uniref:Asialoglycoprotein receptor-like 1 n=1 Tax=Sphaeramia orbicularis TaxID=375764 RepID=A0A673CB07_9TELE
MSNCILAETTINLQCKTHGTFLMLISIYIKLQDRCSQSIWRRSLQSEVNTEFFIIIKIIVDSSFFKLISCVLIFVKPDRCREGWSSFQNSCYLLSNAVLTWKQAETQCQTLGGHLLVLNDVIIDIRYSFWIGLVERQHEGHWSWVDGTDFSSTPTFWDEGQPDNWDYRENGEDCGQLHGSEKRKRKMWNDADCFLQYRYICEAKA